MKARTIITLLVTGIVIGAVAAYFLINQGTAESAHLPSAAEGTFGAVTEQLDPGGDLYLYWNTSGLVTFAEKVMDGIQSTLENQPADGTTREKNLKWFHLVRRMVGETGLYRAKAMGVSSRSLEDGLHRTRMVLYRDPGNTTDLIWNLHASSPHDMPELDFLPRETVLAQFGDFKPRAFWDWLQAQAEKSDIQEFKKSVSMLEPLLKTRGIDILPILDGFSGSAGLVVTMDKERRIAIPMGKKSMEIPAPALALVLGVQDYRLFDLLAANLPGDKGDKAAAVRRIQLPAPPSPLFSSPAITCNGSYMIFASSGELADYLMSGKGGLRESSEFRNLARGIPARGNGFRFISPRLGEVIRGIQKTALDNPELKEKDRKTMKTFMNLLPLDLSMYGVLEHDATGFRYTLNHRLGIHHMVILPAVMAAGIAAAVAIPTMVKKMEMNRRAATLARMRSLSMQIAAHIAAHGSPPQSIEAVQDGWGNPIIYRRGTDTVDYSLASGGADGRFEGWEQRGAYNGNDPANNSLDLILMNGKLVYGPAK